MMGSVANMCLHPREFGAIFAELLPGNFAKLQPPQGQDFMEGLEVKVQLGQVWKQSLTELSGGQRYVSFSTLFACSNHKTLLDLSLRCR